MTGDALALPASTTSISSINRMKYSVVLEDCELGKMLLLDESAWHPNYHGKTMMDVGFLAECVAKSLAVGEKRGSTLRLVRQFIMDLNNAEEPSILMSVTPPSTGDRRWDALIAGVVEDFCIHHGCSAPSWVFDPSRYLDRWWFFTTVDAMRPTAIVETPATISNHGVFIQRASLVNV